MKLVTIAGFFFAVFVGTAAAQDTSQPDSYIWYDGGKPRRVWLDTSVVAEFGNHAENKSALSGKPEPVRIRRQDDPAVARAAALGQASPVLRDSTAGRMRALPGNVIVRLDPGWNAAQVDAWLGANGLAKVRQLPIGNNVLVISAPTGLASLELANRLQESGTVVSAQPEWWEQAGRR